MPKSSRITSAELAKIAPQAAKQLKEVKQTLTEAEKRLKEEQSKASEQAQIATRKAFYKLLALESIPEPVHEFKFHPKRMWRADFAWPFYRLILEVEGGVFSGGRHTRGSGFLGDMEKYNTASSMGWIIIRTTPTELLKTKTVDLIRTTITSIREQKL